MQCCYLLDLVEVQDKGGKDKTYVGYTVDPIRRLRQHNGEISAGAKRTRGNQWKHAVVVIGFPSKFSALSFEWAWQNPFKSRFSKAKLKPFHKGLRGLGKAVGVRRKLLALAVLLQCRPFCQFPLIVVFPTSDYYDFFESLFDPGKFPKQIGKELPRLDDNIRTLCDPIQSVFEEQCKIRASCKLFARSTCCIVCACGFEPKRPIFCCSCCNECFHPTCLSKIFLRETSPETLIPKGGDCPSCGTFLRWTQLVLEKGTLDVE